MPFVFNSRMYFCTTGVLLMTKPSVLGELSCYYRTVKCIISVFEIAKYHKEIPTYTYFVSFFSGQSAAWKQEYNCNVSFCNDWHYLIKRMEVRKSRPWLLFPGVASWFCYHCATWLHMLITTTRFLEPPSCTQSPTPANAILPRLERSLSALRFVQYQTPVVVSGWLQGPRRIVGSVENITQVHSKLMEYLKMPHSGYIMVGIVMECLVYAEQRQ